MLATNAAVQMVCNMTLKQYGSDLYIGIMTIITSVRDILVLPVQGFSQGAQPVLGYNYGAEKKWQSQESNKIYVCDFNIIYCFSLDDRCCLSPIFYKDFYRECRFACRRRSGSAHILFGFFLYGSAILRSNSLYRFGQTGSKLFFLYVQENNYCGPYDSFTSNFLDAACKRRVLGGAYLKSDRRRCRFHHYDTDCIQKVVIN